MFGSLEMVKAMQQECQGQECPGQARLLGDNGHSNIAVASNTVSGAGLIGLAFLVVSHHISKLGCLVAISKLSTVDGPAAGNVKGGRASFTVTTGWSCLLGMFYTVRHPLRSRASNLDVSTGCSHSPYSCRGALLWRLLLMR